MKIISIINYKGGVGKTTVTANLGADLASREKRVLAIDLDPQASLTFSFFSVDQWKQEFEEGKTIKKWYDAFIDKDKECNLRSLISHPKAANVDLKGRLDLICSHLGLINVDQDLANRVVGAAERDFRNNYLRVYSRLRDGLASLRADEYDFVLIDCPPNFNIVTKTAIAASDFLLIPTKPDYLSTLGIAHLQKHVNDWVRTFNNYVSEIGSSEWSKIDPKILGVFFTMIQIYNQRPIASQQQYIEVTRRLGLPILEAYIRENNAIYGTTPEYGVPVVLKRKAGQINSDVRKELENLTTEIMMNAAA